MGLGTLGPTSPGLWQQFLALELINSIVASIPHCEALLGCPQASPTCLEFPWPRFLRHGPPPSTRNQAHSQQSEETTRCPVPGSVSLLAHIVQDFLTSGGHHSHISPFAVFWNHLWPFCVSDILRHSYLQMEFFFLSFKTTKVTLGKGPRSNRKAGYLSCYFSDPRFF